MRLLILGLALLAAACGQKTAPETETAVIEVTSDLPISPMSSDAELEANAREVMASINPLENDLRDLEIAVRLKDAFQIKTTRGVEFELSVTMGDGTVPIDETFVLTPDAAIESSVLNAARREGFYVARLRLDPADRARMGAAGDKLQELRKTSNGNNELTFNATAFTCVPQDVEAPDTYSLTVFARTSPDVEFITLSDEWLVERSDMAGVRELWDKCDS